MSKTKKTSNVFIVDLKLNLPTGERKISTEWLGVKVPKNLKHKYDKHIGRAGVSILPTETINEVRNFKQKVRNSMVVKFVPLRVGNTSIRLMSEDMRAKAQREFLDLLDEYNRLSKMIDKEYESYEKDFYGIFEKILKRNPEKDSIIKEINAIMPSKNDLLSSFNFEFDNQSLVMTDQLKNRFIGKALSIGFEMAGKIIKNNDERKLQERTIAAFLIAIDEINTLGVSDEPIVKYILEDLGKIHSLNCEGKAAVNMAKKMQNKTMETAMKINVVDMVGEFAKK